MLVKFGRLACVTARGAAPVPAQSSTDLSSPQVAQTMASCCPVYRRPAPRPYRMGPFSTGRWLTWGAAHAEAGPLLGQAWEQAHHLILCTYVICQGHTCCQYHALSEV